MAKIEFYVNGADKHIAVLDDDAVPRKGEYINIHKQTYRVDRVTWAVDSEPDRFYGKLRANVDLSPVGIAPTEPPV